MNAAPRTTPAASARLSATLERIVLTGFMGAGKSSAGRLLAEALGWTFLDLDAHIEARAEATIVELFRTVGEARFRHLESAALANALGRRSTVIALGGGAAEAHTNRLLLEQTPGTTTVFLDAPFPVLFDRCMLESIAAASSLRPLLSSPAEAEARFLARQPLYRRIADYTVDVSAHNPEQTCAAILEALRAI